MIDKIIENSLIDIHFQPIVSVSTKTIFALEALTRCEYNNQNIPPDLLFKMAKQNNLLLELDILARNKAIKKFLKYYKKNNDLILFLNFESSLLNDLESFEKINSFLETIIELKIPFKNFVLEIKEDEISNTEVLNKFCKQYKKLGFYIALDDFGTGSSTFDRINLIRPDIIKIDKSLFTDFENQINKEIVKAIAKMSHNLGIRVLAEGVEEEQIICASLKSLINLYQGFYFSKPKAYIDNNDMEKIEEKIIYIANIFKEKNIKTLNDKRKFITTYDQMITKIISQINSLDSFILSLKKSILIYENVEAMYLIDAKTSKQVYDTFIIKNINDRFKPTKDGFEHYLKEYYYITLESKKGIFLSQKYISYATGSLCKTFAKKFTVSNKEYILCIDIVL
ncbi:EAL domain-containing protein [Arcobacter sp. YIC-80]|uniref:EAL domain-containing protein n=1 Tax=unclassified Arcobacter TaxID=2593671 RepID=UPI00384C3110